MNSSYRWAIVAIGALMTCVALGVMFSLAVFLDPLAKDTGWSRAGISAAMTVNFLVMGAGAFGWGALSDRYGARIVVSIGAVLLGLAMVLASRATSLPQFQLIYGVLLGVAADRYGAKRILIAGLLAQALAIYSYSLIGELDQFYMLAVVFGIAYGGVMPLYASLARDYFSQKIMGTVFGAATMLSSIGMATGPLAGGWVFDTFGGYSWPFVASGALGLGAAAMAFAFPRPPQPQLQPA